MVDGTEAPGGIDGNGLQIGYQYVSQKRASPDFHSLGRRFS